MPIYKMDGKKDGLQKYRVRINYIDQQGKARQLDRVAYGSQTAKDLERQLNMELTQNPTVKLTLEDLYKEYTVSKNGEVRETTLAQTKQMLDRFVVPQLGRIKLDKLTVAELQRWKNTMSGVTKSNGEPYSLVYKNNVYKAFVALLNYGVKLEYLSNNPLHKIGPFRDANITPKKEMDFYQPEEFLKYIAAAKTAAVKQEKCSNSIREWNYYIFFMIAFYTGMRKGEINALKWSDISDNVIHVTRSIAQKLKGADRETAPKNASSIRDIRIPKPLSAALSEHWSRCSQIDGCSREWRVCGGPKCLRDTSIDKHNRKYAELAGIKRIRIHDFRHSHASVLINEGINIKEIARRLGHSDVEVTWNTYAHLYPREEERAVSILNKIV